jgi:predicted metal-dependent phosphoesterase TrpH
VIVSRVDLHLHSTASDGRFSPEEVVRKSAEHGLSVIAIADHDTVDGIAPALAAAEAFSGLRVIPAVEISTYVPRGEAHILGYFIDYTSQELKVRLKRMRSGRRERAQAMIAKLKDLDLPISWQRVQEIAGTGSIGRPHIAQAMLEKGYVASFGEVFAEYLGRGGPAYVEWQKIAPAEAVELILQANGLPVLAHPLTVANMETMVVELKGAGLAGIEAYYNGYTADDVAELIALADKHELVATGGSDYHGLPANIETVIGGVDVPLEAVDRLIALAEQRGLEVADRYLQ